MKKSSSNSVMADFWPLTRTLVVVEANVKKVAEACYKYHRTKYIFPGDKVTRFDLAKFTFDSLSGAFDRLLPVSVHIHRAAKVLIVPVRGGCAIIQNNAQVVSPNLITYLSKKLSARTFYITGDGSLAGAALKNRTIDLGFYFKGPWAKAALSSKNEKVTYANGDLKFFGIESAPKKFTNADFLKALDHAKIPAHDDKFYLTSKKAVAWEITWVPDPSFTPEKQIDLPAARKQWLRAEKLK